MWPGWSAKLTVAGVNDAPATGVSAGAAHGADGPPTTPGPFSKMVDSVSASGTRPSQRARDSAAGMTVPVGLVPPTAFSTSAAVRPVYVAVHLVPDGLFAVSYVSVPSPAAPARRVRRPFLSNRSRWTQPLLDLSDRERVAERVLGGAVDHDGGGAGGDGPPGGHVRDRGLVGDAGGVVGDADDVAGAEIRGVDVPAGASWMVDLDQPGGVCGQRVGIDDRAAADEREVVVRARREPGGRDEVSGRERDDANAERSADRSRPPPSPAAPRPPSGCRPNRPRRPCSCRCRWRGSRRCR